MQFSKFANLVKANIQQMVTSGNACVTVNLTGDQVYDHYLASFPEGSNPMFVTRTEHDCSCCKSFIRQVGNMVTIDATGKIFSVWDGDIGIDQPEYQAVTEALSKLIHSAVVDKGFCVRDSKIGTETSYVRTKGADDIKWNHFNVKFPSNLTANRSSSYEEMLGKQQELFSMLKTVCSTITVDACETVLDLISQKSLYRGDEFKSVVVFARDTLLEYNKAADKNNWLWFYSFKHESKVRFKNSLIGTLLVDLSGDMDLDAAVRSYGSKLENYKHPTTLYTKKMVESFRVEMEKLGLESSLYRRHANFDDLDPTQVIFRDVNKGASLQNEDPLSKLLVPTKQFKASATVTIEDFINNVVPTATKLEILMESRLASNLVSLITAVDSNSEYLTKWGNHLTWSYNGEVTDAIKQRVKEAGGNVNGHVRVSLSWSNTSDYDLHVQEPGGTHICFHSYKNRKAPSTGMLDVDMNVGGESTSPVENIFWTDGSKMPSGVYSVEVDCYTYRGRTGGEFTIQVEHGGQIFNFDFPTFTRSSHNSNILKFDYDAKTDTLTINGNQSKNAVAGKEIWGITSNTWVNVDTLMLSPNFWHDKSIGNKHYMFMLSGCANPEPTRGFYNEFLRDELTPHRKVLQGLGSAMTAEPCENQLSGVGFSSTLRNTVMVKVSGRFERIINVTF